MFINKDKLWEILKDFLLEIEKFGTDTKKMKPFNQTTSKTTGNVFKYQNEVIYNLKARKKEVEEFLNKKNYEMNNEKIEFIEEKIKDINLQN